MGFFHALHCFLTKKQLIINKIYDILILYKYMWMTVLLIY